jgi:acetoacetyl-CoA synthetase
MARKSLRGIEEWLLDPDAARAAAVAGPARSARSDWFPVLDAVPRTLDGRTCEAPVERILAETEPARAARRGSLRNPEQPTGHLGASRAHG